MQKAQLVAKVQQDLRVHPVVQVQQELMEMMVLQEHKDHPDQPDLLVALDQKVIREIQVVLDPLVELDQ